MAEPGKQEQKDISSQNFLFPLSKIAVDKVLMDLETGKWVMMSGYEEMLGINPLTERVDHLTGHEGLLENLNYIGEWEQSDIESLDKKKRSPRSCKEGGYLAFKIISEQAKMQGKLVPIVSFKTLMAHRQGMFEMQRNWIEKRGNLSGVYLKKIEAIGNEDPEFRRAIKEAGRYSLDKEDFYLGALSVYLPIKAAQIAQSMKDQFPDLSSLDAESF